MTPDEFDSRLDTIQRRISRLSGGESRRQDQTLEDLRAALEELRAADEELRQQNEELVAAHLQVDTERERYRDLFEMAPDAYLVTDRAGIIRESNRSASRMLRVAPEFLNGKALAAYIEDDDRPRFRALLTEIRRGRCEGQTSPFKLRPRRSEPLDVEMTHSVLCNRERQPTGLRWILRDVTEQQRMARSIQALNQELENQVADRTDDLNAAQRLSQDLLAREQAARQAAEASEAQSRHVQKLESIGVLAGGIAHDFNNLLHVVLGNADIALSDLPEDSAARGPLEEVIRATFQAADLTRQLLAYSGKGAIIVRHLDLSSEVRDMATLLRTAISKQAVLDCDLAADLPAIRADATQIRQVVMNLITNASDALDAGGGTIRLRTGVLQPEEVNRQAFDPLLEGGMNQPAQGPFVYLEVIDTGQGMTPETLARIFDPFFSTKFSGRGLGLAAVMGIVRAHRGLIRIRTEPGLGTSFRVLFPPVPGAAHPHQSAAGSRSEWRGQGTVLVVDDEEGVREVAERMLQEIGFETLTAEDGLQALEVLARSERPITGVLLDLSMPHLGGRETLRRIRTSHPSLPVIIMSGYTEEVFAQQIGDTTDPATGFLQKPFLHKDLVAVFREVVQAAAA